MSPGSSTESYPTFARIELRENPGKNLNQVVAVKGDIKRAIWQFIPRRSKADGNAALARRLYQERYPQRQCPDRKIFVRLHYLLCEYGKFNSPGLGRGRPRSTTPEVQEEILEAVNMTPSISTRRVALQVNVPHTTVWRLLKEYQLYPYHLQRVQALSPADYPARVRFCQWFLQ
ncbi:hypothetical protein ANN_21207 [Periplaneta americana]|uniref:DUF4817 domain-containing protein n=1 Tax=Periplaneta americana TaxID=6978 RepID=A0ABQ8SEQ1_PERAM|nr:hypothetical protein ANN_21207 [Periplaneta americana]